MTTQTPLQIALVPLHNQLREAGKFLSAAQNTSATTPATLPQAQAQAATALTAASEAFDDVLDQIKKVRDHHAALDAAYAETERLIQIDATIGRLLSKFEESSMLYHDLSNHVDPVPYYEQRNALFALLRKVILVPDAEIV